MVCPSFSRFVFIFETFCISHHNGISHAPHFRRAWSSSCCGEGEGEGAYKIQISRGYLYLGGGSKDTFPREDLKLKGIARIPKETMFNFPF